MRKLIKGVHHFQTHVFLSHKELFQRLSEGQTPDALFITCADSRINPNLITHTNPGDLFILRNAGNIIPPYGAANGGEGATIEFAVAGLGVKDIIVCGHTLCGAMKGLIYREQLQNLPMVDEWLNHAESTRRIIRENYGNLSDEPEELLNVTIQENVLVQLENLRTHPAIAARLSRGELNLHGWTYKIETGDVFSYNPEAGQFLPLAESDFTPAQEGGRPRLAAAGSI